MQRADRRDVERRGFFQYTLHLRTVFADDTDIVTSGLVCPGLVRAGRAEFAAIFLMLTLLSEANFALRRPEAWRRYFCYAPTAILLSMTLAVPDLIAAAAYRTAVISDLYYDILLFTIGLHQAARLGAVAFAKEN